MAKSAREQAVRARRARKQEKKDDRKNAAAAQASAEGELSVDAVEAADEETGTG